MESSDYILIFEKFYLLTFLLILGFRTINIEKHIFENKTPRINRCYRARRVRKSNQFDKIA
jgi:hypothetical protein